MLPAASIARTWNLWWPSVRPVGVHCDEQADQGAASTLHWKVEPGSEEENANPSPGEVENGPGPASMVVSGGVVSSESNRAVTVRDCSMATAQSPTPAQPPPVQPAKAEPVPGAACSVTGVSLSKPNEQVVGQL